MFPAILLAVTFLFIVALVVWIKVVIRQLAPPANRRAFRLIGIHSRQPLAGRYQIR